MTLLFVSLAIAVFSLAAAAAAEPPQAKRPKECRLMINWDQMNMCALQLTYAHRRREPTAESVKTSIEQIVDEHAKAKIDRIVQCVFALPRGTVPGGFTSFYRDDISDRPYQDTPVGFEALETGGYDRVQVMLERAHHNGIEFLGGLRMNDRHKQTSPFHAAHPDWQLPEYPGGMDYKHPGVRQAVLDFIDEFLVRYDVDGLELDWMRWCHVFRPSEAERNAPLLNEFIAGVRKRLDKSASQRGRGRLLLGVRIPQSLPECRSLGYDVATWIRSGDLDFVCPSDFFYTDFNLRTEEFVKLTEGTAVKVYPSLHPLISWGNDHLNQTRDSYRAAAKNYLTFGAHGLSAYNYQYHWRADKGKEDDWPGVLDYLTDLRELRDIEQGTRRYLFHPMWSGHGGGIGPSGTRRDVRIVLERGKPTSRGTLDLRLAEDLKTPGVRAWLECKAVGLAKDDGLMVMLHGVKLSDQPHERHRDEDGQSAREGRVLPAFDLFRFPLKASDVRSGDNHLSVVLEARSGTDEVVIQEIEVLVQTSATKAK